MGWNAHITWKIGTIWRGSRSFLVIGGVCAFVLVFSACRTEADGSAQSAPSEKRFSPDVSTAAKVVTKEKPRPRRLPPPLLPPSRPVSGFSEEWERPCEGLVDRVCVLLGQGSEECGEARVRLERRIREVREDRCQSSLDWYRSHLDGGRRGRACRMLAVAICHKNGADSTSCVAATEKANTSGLDERSKAACLADLLMLKGFL